LALGRAHEARRTLRYWLNQAQSRGDSAQAAHAVANWGIVEERTGRWAKARQLYRRAVETLGPGHPNAAGPLLNLSALLQNTGRSREARTVLEHTRDIAISAGDRRTLAVVFYNLSIVELSAGNDQSVCQLLNEAERLAETINHWELQARCRIERAARAMEAGLPDQAAIHLSVARTTAAKIGSVYFRAMTDAFHARLYAELGDIEETRRLAAAVLDGSAELGISEARIIAHLAQSKTLLLSGFPAAALAAATSVGDEAVAAGERMWELEALLLRADIVGQLGSIQALTHVLRSIRKQ